MSRENLKRMVANTLSSIDYVSLLKYLSILAIFAGLFYVAKGVYAVLQPPIDVAELRIVLTVKFPGVFGELLGGKLIVEDVNAYVPVVYRYDALHAPEYGVLGSPWSECSSGLVVSFFVDGIGYGPYCFGGSLESLVGLEQDFEWVFALPPGKHDIRVLMTVNNNLVYSKTLTVSLPSYDSLVGGEGGS